LQLRQNGEVRIFTPQNSTIRWRIREVPSVPPMKYLPLFS
jgi:hypothetical protein